MFNKEISYYTVYVYGTDGSFGCTEKHTEEEAVAYAREQIRDKNTVRKVRIEQVSNVIGWED